ncbi:MAG: hypothetical protein K6V36_00515 [Anaerolineae bacterium]|nr:hypothetical protein [Anaerolineae bacterium]
MAELSLVLGLDIGTSTIKAGLFTLDGRQVALATDEYLVIPESSLRVEVDPEVFWQGACRVVRRVLAQVPNAPMHIVSLSVSSHGETLILLRSDGRPARAAIFTTDARAEAEALEIAASFEQDWLLKHTGQPELLGLWPACKIAWLRRHEPDAFADIAHFLLPGDYVICRLSGAVSAETSVWGSSMMVDLCTRDWLEPVLELVGVRRHKLPELVPSGTLVGRVTAEAAAETGLPSGTPVVVGAMDQVCAAIAAGNVRPGIVTASTGSVLALLATTERPIFDPITRISCYTHAVPGTYCVIPWNPTGGLVLKWFKDRFGDAEHERARATGQSAYDLLCQDATGVPPGCEGLVMLPHLQGVLFPETDLAARGVFFGFSLSHSRAHFTRAILEAVAFMLRDGLEALDNLGVTVNEVYVLGGGARSQLWLQIKADVCQRPLAVPETEEAAVLGAGILAAVGASVYPDLIAASQSMVRVARRVQPDPALALTYEEAYSRYHALYKQLKPLFHAFRSQ